MNPLIAPIALALCLGAHASHAATLDLRTLASTGSTVVTANSAELLTNGSFFTGSSISGDVDGLTSFEYYYSTAFGYVGSAVYSTTMGSTTLGSSFGFGTDSGWKTVNLAQPYTGALSFTSSTTLSVFTSGSLSIRNVQVAAVIPPVLAPVPEPESYAMLLAGLGVMGALARRRGRKGADAVSAAARV